MPDATELETPAGLDVGYGLLSDAEIERYVTITPFVREPVEKGVVSYGLTSYGYDCRVGYKFKVFTPALCAVVDPKNLDPKAFVDVDLTPHNRKHEPGSDYDYEEDGIPPYVCRKCGAELFGAAEILPCPKAPQVPNFITIPPNSFALAETVEWFDIPPDILATCVGKSTYARCGVVIPVTPLEPAWRGKVTVEISNTTPLPAKVYAGEGIMQVLFTRGNRPCRVPYSKKGDGGGKYMDQPGLTLPFTKTTN